MTSPTSGYRIVVPAVIGGLAVLPLWALPRQEATGIAQLMHVAALSVALLFMIKSARASDPAVARTRWWLAASLATSAAGALIGAAYVAATGSIPVPSVVDAVTLMWVPLAAYGFWRVPTRAGLSTATPRLLADGAVAVSSLFFASWVAVLQPVAAKGEWGFVGRVVQLGYPVGDVFVVAIVLSLLPRARADLRPMLNYVAAGLLLLAVSDSGYALMLAERGTAQFAWNDVAMQAGLMLIAVGACTRLKPILREYAVASSLDRNLPYAAVVLAAGVGLWHVASGGALDLGDAIVGAVMLGTIVVRQIVYTHELGAAAQDYQTAAVHDALTLLANRKAFFSRLAEHLATPGAGNAAVLLFDLDGFKEVNDTLGHEAGDDVLVAFGRTLRAAAPTHLVARLGGDEFAILVVAEDAETAAITLAWDITSRGAGIGTSPSVGLGSSIGIAVLRDGDTPADALRRADLAMYSAKRSPTARLAVFSEDMADEAQRRHLLVAALAGAVDRGEMRLVYQPLYRLGDASLAGAEVLLRWTHPLFGAVPPDECIPLAEESGHINQIGAWVLEQSVAQMAAWERQGRHLPQLYVNVAARQFTDDLPALVADVLDRHGMQPSRLTLEITESQLPDLAANRPMQVLRKSGVQIALDDFGAGYSSLAQLARLPVDILKIDRDFIRNLGEAAGRPVMDAIINLAKALGLVTVAEGIEDMGQAVEATNAGVDFAQGYLFSRPIPPEELADRLPQLGECAPALPSPRNDSSSPVYPRS